MEVSKTISLEIDGEEMDSQIVAIDWWEEDTVTLTRTTSSGDTG